MNTNNKTIWYIAKYAMHGKYGITSRQFSFSEEFVKMGFNICIFASSNSHISYSFPNYTGKYFNEIINGVNVFWLKSPKYYKSKSIKRFWSWIMFEYMVIRYSKLINTKPDYVVVSSLSLFSIFSGIYFKIKYKAKLIFEVRDIWPLTIMDLYNFSKYNPFILLLSCFEKYAYLNADLIVGSMLDLSKHVKNVTNKDLKVVHIPQGFDKVLYKYNNGVSHIPMDLPKDKFIVAYSGTLGIFNGLEYLISAARKMEKYNPRFHFLLIGDGAKSEYLKQLSEGLDNVQFINKVDRLMLQYIFKHVNVLYFATLRLGIYDFGVSPNKLMDYLYSGKPILASFSGRSEIIENARAFFVVPSENSDQIFQQLNKIFSMDSSILNKMGEDGKNYLLKEHDYELLAQKYISYINEI